MPDTVCATPGKTGYPNKSMASKAKAALLRGRRRDGRGELQVYMCGRCNRWHVGHRMRTVG